MHVRIVVIIEIKPWKLTFPLERMKSTPCPVKIGTYKVRATVITEKSRDNKTNGVYGRIQAKIRFNVDCFLVSCFDTVRHLLF